ncbi:unnamed protein product [Brassica oleracea var. botrytis]
MKRYATMLSEFTGVVPSTFLSQLFLKCEINLSIARSIPQSPSAADVATVTATSTTAFSRRSKELLGTAFIPTICANMAFRKISNSASNRFLYSGLSVRKDRTADTKIVRRSDMLKRRKDCLLTCRIVFLTSQYSHS